MLTTNCNYHFFSLIAFLINYFIIFRIFSCFAVSPRIYPILIIELIFWLIYLRSNTYSTLLLTSLSFLLICYLKYRIFCCAVINIIFVIKLWISLILKYFWRIKGFFVIEAWVCWSVRSINILFWTFLRKLGFGIILQKRRIK